MNDIIKKIEEAMVSIPINDYQTRIRLLDAIEYIKQSKSVLEKAVSVIKQWHQADDVWDIYFNHSPEMKPIREFMKSDSHAA